MYTRYAERRRWTVEVRRRARDRDRRLQGGRLRDQGAGRLLAPQVRERRPPRPARAGDRGAGAHPHSTATVAVLPEVEEVEVADQPGGPADRHLPRRRRRRPERQQGRDRGAAHPHPDRHRRAVPGRALAAAEPRQGDGRAARAPLRPRDAQADAAADRDARRSQVGTRRARREDPHLQLPPGPHHRPPRRLQGAPGAAGARRRARPDHRRAGRRPTATERVGAARPPRTAVVGADRRADDRSARMLRAATAWLRRARPRRGAHHGRAAARARARDEPGRAATRGSATRSRRPARADFERAARPPRRRRAGRLHPRRARVLRARASRCGRACWFRGRRPSCWSSWRSSTCARGAVAAPRIVDVGTAAARSRSRWRRTCRPRGSSRSTSRPRRSRSRGENAARHGVDGRVEVRRRRPARGRRRRAGTRRRPTCRTSRRPRSRRSTRACATGSRGWRSTAAPTA